MISAHFWTSAERQVCGWINQWKGMQEKLLNEDSKMKFEEAVKNATTNESSKI